MENQHRKITGYRELSQSEIDMMNEIKEFEASWNGLIDRLREMKDVDQREVSIAVTEAENAFMRAVRSVARPDRKVK